MLTCRELTELVTDYLEGRLSFLDRLRFQMHLGMCRHCRAYLRQLKQTIRALGELPQEPIPPELRRVLLERFRDWKREANPGATPLQATTDGGSPGHTPDTPVKTGH